MAHTLSNEKEHAFTPPILDALEVVQTDDADKAGKNTGNTVLMIQNTPLNQRNLKQWEKIPAATM